MPKPLLFVAAVPPETRDIAQEFRAQPSSSKPFSLESLELPVGGHRAWILTTGIGPAAAAAGLTWALGKLAPAWVLQVGSAGSFDLGELPLEAVALVREDRFGDLGTQLPGEPWQDGAELGIGPPPDQSNRFPLRIPEAIPETFDFPVREATALTVSHVAGSDSDRIERRARSGALLESMEGAATAMVAALFEVPCLQFRGISNLAGGPRGGWKFAEANRNAQRVALAWAKTLPETP